MDHIEAATFPPLLARIAHPISLNALVVDNLAKTPPGWDVARDEVSMLDIILGEETLPSDLRWRLEESMEKGEVIEGNPPDWHTLVRQGALKRIDS